MSVNVPQHFAPQYATNIQTLLQQQGSRLRDKVMTGPQKGEAGSPVDQVGSINMLPVTTRFSPMGRVDAPLDRRWVFPNDFELPQLVDSFDKLKLLIDPTSTYVTNAVYAAGREFDKAILNAMNVTNYTGKTSSTNAIALPSAQKIAVNFGASGNTALTVAKLKEAKKKIMAADVNLDADPLTCAITAADHDSLLSEAQVISTDYNDRPVLVEGRVIRFLGIDLVHTELVETSGGNRLVPVWAKSGVYLGIWEDIMTDISQRKDISSLPWQAYVKISIGATRLEEKKVVQITCA